MSHKQIKIGSVALLAVVFAILVWSFFYSRREEVTYAGKPQSYWMNMLATNPAYATRSLGTNAKPVLLAALEKQGNPVSAVLRTAWPKLPHWVKSNWRQPVDAANVRSNAAVILKGIASPPELMVILRTNSDPIVRLIAVVGLEMNFDRDVTLALIDAFDDKSTSVRRQAFMAINMHNRDLNFPEEERGRDWALRKAAWRKAMTNSDTVMRASGIRALENLLDSVLVIAPATVKEFAPELVRALKDKNEYVREQATNVLSRGAPAEFEKATRNERAGGGRF